MPLPSQVVVMRGCSAGEQCRMRRPIGADQRHVVLRKAERIVRSIARGVLNCFARWITSEDGVFVAS